MMLILFSFEKSVLLTTYQIDYLINLNFCRPILTHVHSILPNGSNKLPL